MPPEPKREMGAKELAILGWTEKEEKEEDVVDKAKEPEREREQAMEESTYRKARIGKSAAVRFIAPKETAKNYGKRPSFRQCVIFLYLICVQRRGGNFLKKGQNELADGDQSLSLSPFFELMTPV